MIKRNNYPLFDIYTDEIDVDYVSKVIKRGSFWAVGPEIKEFEEKLKLYFKSKFAVLFSNGTAALHSLLLAHGITTGEVIVPSFTFIASANAIVLAGGKPVFAEIESKSLGLDPNDVESKITKETKAIIAVHYGGKVCRYIKKLREIADKFNLILIEDNAESFGAKMDNIFAGKFGHSTILSFCQNKILPTGEGGAVITDNVKIFEKLTLIRSHGRVELPNINYFNDIHQEDYIEVGYNYRMPTICAALGLAQFSKIEKILKLRRKVGQYYDKCLESIAGVEIIPEMSGCYSVFQLYSIFIQDPENRSHLQEFLLKKGIYTKIYFAPAHLKSYYRKKFLYSEGDLPITEEISRKILTLPMSLNFSKEDQDYIIEAIRDFFSK